jgi:hypothetical protein
MQDSFLERVRRLFAGGDETVSISKENPEHRHLLDKFEAVQAAGIRRLIDKLDAQGSTSLVGGCVELLGLEQIKDKLGPQWDAFSNQALAIAEEVLDQHLGPGDIYRPVGEFGYQICFETGDEGEAQRQVGGITKTITDRISRELIQADQAVSVDSFVASVPSQRIRDASDPMSTLYSSLVAIRDAVNKTARKRHSIPALQYAGALFQPLWSHRDFGTTKNRCVLDTLAGAAAAKHLQEIEDLDDLVEALANLDCVLFAKSVEGLHHALGEIKSATIVIPVHFQTLASRQPDFMELALTLPLPYRKFVIIDLIGVPTAATQVELLRAVHTGRSIADRVVLQLSPSDHRMDQRMQTMIWGASISLTELDSDDHGIAQDLSRFALSAAEIGLYSFAYGANTMGKAAVTVKAGFDYICGTAVHSTVPAPRPHARFTPLFGDAAAHAGDANRQPSGRRHARFAPLNPNSTITLPDGMQTPCRISNVSASGAAVLSSAALQAGDYLALGSIGAQVVRAIKGGFAVRFLEVQQPSVVEIALQTPVAGDHLLANLRVLSS